MNLGRGLCHLAERFRTRVTSGNFLIVEDRCQTRGGRLNCLGTPQCPPLTLREFDTENLQDITVAP